MKTIFLVKEDEADMARKIEAKLMALPSSTGILFVGVSISPSFKGDTPHYRIWIGCHRDFDESLMSSIVTVTLRDEVKAGLTFTVEAHRGIARALVPSLRKVVD